MSSIVSQVPFIKTSRNFPQEAQPLSLELSRAYIDLASGVNSRTIGIFPTNKPAVTGESWFISDNQKQQTLRQVYMVTGAGSIAHGINLNQISGFARIFGAFTDGTNWYPLPYVDVAAATNQVNIVVTGTNIVITRGAGAPAITQGTVVLEWLSNT